MIDMPALLFFLFVTLEAKESFSRSYSGLEKQLGRQQLDMEGIDVFKYVMRSDFSL